MSEKITNKEINNKINEIIDNLIKAGKDNVRELINLLIKKTAQSSEEKFDMGITQLKKKINERLKINEEKK